MSYIKIKNVSKSFGSLRVLIDLSLDIIEGETLVILGRSGTGKSVLLKQIIGIDQPDSGEIFVGNEKVTGKELSSNFIKQMGMLFQGAALFDSMTVGENTAFYLNEHGDPLTGRSIAPKEIKERVAHALEMVGLQGTEAKMPSDLSGGMRKRAGLARVIIYRPKIILYDEPTTGLDPVTAMQINDLINKTKEELKATSIVVTHDIRSAMEVGNRIAFQSEGKIAYIDKKENFVKIQDPLLQSFFENAIVREEHLKS